MAIWFSSSLAVLWFASSVLYLAACTPSGSHGGLQRVECSNGHRGVEFGPNPTLWGVVVAFSLLSTVGYAVHAAMAVKVLVVVRTKEREDRKNGVVEPPVQADSDLAREARERWERLLRYEL